MLRRCANEVSQYHDAVMALYRIPRNLEGRGWAYLRCEDRVGQAYQFDRLTAQLEAAPRPFTDDDWELWDDEGPSKRDRYRIALPGFWPGGGRAKVRFALGKGTPKTALEVIARHLDDVGVDWMWLTDADGSRIKGVRFCSHLMLQRLYAGNHPQLVNA